MIALPPRLLAGFRVSCSIGFVAVAGAAAPAAERLSVDVAVELAMGGNRRLQQGSLAVDVTRDRERQARAFAYPQVSGGVLVGRLLAPLDLRFPAGSLGTYAATGPLPGRAIDVRADPGLAMYGNLQLVQPLTQQYKIFQRAEAARRALAAEAEKQKGRRLQVADQVRQACVALLQTQSTLMMLAGSRTFLAEYQRVAQLGVAAASLLKPEAMAVDARLAELDWQEAQARDRLSSAREQLNLLLGRDLATPVEIEPLPLALPEEPELAVAVARAIGGRPDLRQARLEHESAQRSVAAARAERWPEASAMVVQQWMPRMDPLPRSVGYAGVAVQWDIFDGGRRRAEVAAGHRTVEQARLGLVEAEDQVRLEVAAAHRALRQSRLALRGADLTLALEAERLRVARELREADSALLRELLQQRASYESALSSRQHAFFAAWLAHFAFEKSLGPARPDSP